MPDLTESITVQSSADTLYRLVSDLPRMGEWSPECTRVRWSGSASRVVTAGSRFVGHNRVGFVRWFTFGRVVTAEPGRRFTFDITFGTVRISRWDYEFADTADGCTVTESWTDHRPVVLKKLFRPVFGDRTPRNVEGIHTTLLRLKSAAEAAHGR
ncbi:SRPBCC family protein [Kribbella sp.]|uniref:SRPBCC family protein n=1 Tax=Kribbella sp. TaxID=1871183 RepID=UPI002D50E7BE|nr:SRPBCC family protein [Kribbella sp.]HZX03618.1 SRPBCC family protein [Kribbella sp.]